MMPDNESINSVKSSRKTILNRLQCFRPNVPCLNRQTHENIFGNKIETASFRFKSFSAMIAAIKIMYSEISSLGNQAAIHACVR
jgi:phage-related protein